MTISIILAGGTGSRFGATRPKQFLPLDGSLVIEHAIEAFEQASTIDEIAVVVHPQWHQFMADLLKERGWTKVTRLIDGGNKRYLSSLNAIKAYCDAPPDTDIIFHDAARPWVSQRIIADVCQALRHSSAVGVAVPATDTIWQVDGASQRITAIPDRNAMYHAQTPQAFRLATIAEAYRRALCDPDFHATDDCGVLLKYCPEIPIFVVPGDEQNRKITFVQDL